MNARGKLETVAGLLLSFISGWASAQQVDRTDLSTPAGTPLPSVLAAPPFLVTDTTPPTVTAPIQKIANGKVGATVPINVRWSASDADGPVSYKLWRSTNGGAFVRDRTLSPTATSHTYRLTVGNSYRFLVRAYDDAGNSSAPARGPTFTPTVIDNNACCSYTVVGVGSSWIHESSSEAYMGTLSSFFSKSYSTRGVHGYARHTFTGRDVAYVASLGSDWSPATVRIDGVFFSDVNLHRDVSAGAQIVISKHWPSSGTHTIQIGSSGGWFNVDAFVVNE